MWTTNPWKFLNKGPDMSTVNVNSVWSSSENKKFRVLHVIELEGHVWVHYREDQGIKVPATECKEYSCYIESFTERFVPTVE